MGTKLADNVVGAMAMDITKSAASKSAVILLREAVAVEHDDRYSSYHGKTLFGLVLVVPLDFFGMLDDGAKQAILTAANHVDEWHDFVDVRIAPVAEGWRDRLAELDDWGVDSNIGDEWAVINERVHDLRSLFLRAITPDDRADVGRRCRELLIASASAAFRVDMVPEGIEELPKEGDAKTKCAYIIGSLGSGSVDKRLTKLINTAWDLANGLLHNDEPGRVATFSAAQATVLVVRTLAMIRAEYGD